MSIVFGPGSEFADFGGREILFGLTSEEAWLDLSEEDLEVRSQREQPPKYEYEKYRAPD